MHRAVAPLLTLFAVGCVGTIGGDPSDGTTNGPPEPGTFACTPGDPSATVLPRLSREQYLASLQDLASLAMAPQEATTMIASLDPTLTLMPLDLHTDHKRLDQAVNQGHVDAQYHVAVAFAGQLVSTVARQETLLGTCATDGDASNDDACLDDFIRRFGYRAHRKPLTDAEVDFYRYEVFEPADGMDMEGVRDVIGVMVMSPQFVYRVENEGHAVDGSDDLFELSAHELAARLAFHLWDTPPDAALYAAAESGDLLTEDGYAAQVERMLDDPRTQAAVDRYYSEWLLLDDLAPLTNGLGNPDYDAFVGVDVPTAELRDHMLEEALAFTRYTTWQSDGSLADLFTSDVSLAATADIAAIYGVSVWQEGTTPQSAPGRAGILTRAAMLATGSISTHPVLRGREVRKRVLCQDIPMPPANAMDNLPDLDPTMTERDRFEAMTEQPGSSCLGCHALVNPIGYTFGAYDGLGRIRADEPIYAEDGSILSTQPLDTVAAPRIESDDDTVVADAIELSSLLAESTFTHACFARHYFRFAFNRVEDDEIDGCELEEMRTASLEGASLMYIFRTVAMSPTFRQRKLSSE